MKNKIQSWQLKQRQGLPLEIKEGLTANRIRAWYEHWNGEVYVSFSGGKDSTVLLHQVRRMYKNVKAVFVDTGLEYPEIRDFIKTIDNVLWLKPGMHFKKVLEKYGYPIIGKVQATSLRKVMTQNLSDKYRSKLLYGDGKGTAGKISEKWKYLLDADFKISEQCCDVMKKKPIKKFEKETGLKSFVGTMASDSRIRETVFLNNGCNAFHQAQPKSTPMSHWLEDDIWEYIKLHDVGYSKIYDMGEKKTGCIFCMFGVHLEKGNNRFQRMAKTHPKQYDYCINKLGLGEVLDFIGVPYKARQLNLFRKGE